MSKKQLDTQGIANELVGASVFFQTTPLSGSPNTLPKTFVAQRSSSALVRKGEGAKGQSREGAPGEAERMKVKQGFQVYRDQVIALSELQFETYRRTGKRPHIGAFVRSALDDFIARRKRELGKP